MPEGTLLKTKVLEKHQGYPRFWEDTDFEMASLGPKPIPWEMRKFYLNPRSGNFRLAHQKWYLTKKDLTVIDRGFVGDQYIDHGNDSAAHRNGSPVVSFHDMVTCFDLAEREEISLGEAFLDMIKERPDWRVSSHFISEVEKGTKAYPQKLADKLNEMYGLGPSDPLKEVRMLEEENNVLKARKRVRDLEVENESLRDEMRQEQIAVAEKIEADKNQTEPSSDTSEELAKAPRTRRRRRVKKTEDDE